MQVTVKPVPSEKWHGKQGKESFARPKTIEVLFDGQTGAYATGLTPEDEEKYGKLLGVNLSSTFNADSPHEYWSTKPAFIVLPNHTVIFNTDRPTDYVKVKNLKASNDVANSMKEWEEGMWPEATHVIYDETEETELKSTKIAKRNKCIVVAASMTLAEKQNLVQILSNKSVRGQSSDFVEVEIDKIIDEQVDEFIRWAKTPKAEVEARAQVLEGLFKHKLIKNGLNITYMGETIGHDVDQAVEYLMNPDNQEMKIALLNKILN